MEVLIVFKYTGDIIGRIHLKEGATHLKVIYRFDAWPLFNPDIVAQKDCLIPYKSYYIEQVLVRNRHRRMAIIVKTREEGKHIISSM